MFDRLSGVKLTFWQIERTANSLASAFSTRNRLVCPEIFPIAKSTTRLDTLFFEIAMHERQVRRAVEVKNHVGVSYVACVDGDDFFFGLQQTTAQQPIHTAINNGFPI